MRFWILLSFYCAVLPELVLAKAAPPPDTSAGRPLRIGVVPVEPLVIREADGIYDGLAVAMWESIAAREQLTYEYVDIAQDSARAQLSRGAIDLWLAATPRTGSRDTTSHSPIYYASSLAVARRGGNTFVTVIQGLFQPAFFQIITGLSVLLLIIGTIIYFLERRANAEEFGGKMYEGIGAGFWWAGVTLTTIGYGDKSPKTFVGRVVAMLWMLVGLAVSATLTAAIVALATDESQALRLPRDLKNARNLVVRGSSVAPFLERLEIEAEPVGDYEEAFRRVEAREADYVVASAMELDHYMNVSAPSLRAQTSRLVPSYYAIAFRQNLPEADRISALVSEITTSTVWPKWLERYVPEG